MGKIALFLLNILHWVAPKMAKNFVSGFNSKEDTGIRLYKFTGLNRYVKFTRMPDYDGYEVWLFDLPEFRVDPVMSGIAYSFKTDTFQSFIGVTPILFDFYTEFEREALLMHEVGHFKTECLVYQNQMEKETKADGYVEENGFGKYLRSALMKTKAAFDVRGVVDNNINVRIKCLSI